MTRELAIKIVNQLKEKNLPPLTILEAMMMVKIPSDGYNVYSIQKGDVTIMAWVHKDGSVDTKFTCW